MDQTNPRYFGFFQEPEDFLELTKMQMYQDQVFVFTPKGDLVSPKGAMPQILLFRYIQILV